MLYILYSCYTIYTLQSLIRQWGAAEEFHFPKSVRLLWLSAIIFAFVGAVLAAIPRVSVLLPMPLSLGFFLPCIAVGRHVTTKLENLGTSRTEELEKAARNTTWAGIFGAALFLLIWVLHIAATVISARKHFE